LFISFVAALIMIYAIYRKRLIPGVMALVFGVLFFLTYDLVKKVPESLTQATPYLVTLLVLATASQRLRPPAHAGKPYRSGDNH
jgi:simple sugar transport system permease protein